LGRSPRNSETKKLRLYFVLEWRLKREVKAGHYEITGYRAGDTREVGVED
jgi:hypothetical protein